MLPPYFTTEQYTELSLLHEFTAYNKTVQYILYTVIMSCAFYICTMHELD